MSFQNTSNSEGTQPLSTGDDRMASDNNFQEQSSAQPNPQGQGGQTVSQGGYGTSLSGGDQFARENQTGQGFKAETAGHFKPSEEDLHRNENDNNTTNST